MSEILWDGSNTIEVDRLLKSGNARAEPDAGKLHILGIGLNTHISIGDSLMIEGGRLGIKRATVEPQPDKFVTWTGNLLEIDEFLKPYGVRVEVMAERLNIYAGHEIMASLSRGDRITKTAAGEIVVSRVGEHHRV